MSGVSKMEALHTKRERLHGLLRELESVVVAY
jgi:hypothetical protein